MLDVIFFCPGCEREYSPAEVDPSTAVCRHDGVRLLKLSPQLRPGTIVDGRYTLGRPLGSGTMGVVFQAVQHASGRLVALKVINPHHGDASMVRRLMREARASSAIVHPNVVSVLDYGQSREGVAFLALELLEGATLGEVIAAETRLVPAHAAWLALQVAGALEASHALGILHRDLKPSNIFLVAGEGVPRVKVLDFGLAKAIGELADGGLLTQTSTGMMLGTPVYMSPEQYLGEPLAAPSDLYALGCVLYEMLVGRPPFLEHTLFELMRAHLDAAPVPPCLRVPEAAIPPALEALCLALLAKKAGERPGAAELATRLGPLAAPPQHALTAAHLRGEVESAVRTGAQRSGDHEAVAALTMTPHTRELSEAIRTAASPLFRPGLVGREHEREHVEALLDDCLEQRHGALLVLEGAGGVGKSRLLSWLAGLARKQDVQVVTGYHESGGLGPIGAVRDVLEALYDARGVDRYTLERKLAAVGRSAAGALEATVVPGVQGLAELLDAPLRPTLSDFERGQVLGFLRPQLGASMSLGPMAHAGLGEAERRDVLFGALVHALVVGTGGRPTLVLLEDLRQEQPLDETLMGRLADALRDVRAPLLVVLAERSHEGAVAAPAGPAPLSSLESRLGTRLRRVRLTPLDGESLEALVRRALPGATAALVEHVATMSGGNPLYALQLLRHLVSEGALQRSSEGRWVLATQDEASLPADLAGLLDARLARLGAANPDALSVLMRAALFGLRVPVALLEGLLEREGRLDLSEGLEDLLDRLVTDGWLRDEERWDEDVVVFEHGFVRAALVRRLGARRAARRLHGVAAQVLEGHYAGALEAQAWRIAEHWHAAGNAERALPHAIVAARAATRRQALSTASGLWRRVGELLEPAHADAATRLLVARGHATVLLQLGEHDEAEALLAPLGDEDPQVLELRGDLADARADFPGAIRYYETAIEAHEAACDELAAASVRCKTAPVLGKMDALAEAIARSEAAAETARRHGRAALEADALNALAMFAQRTGELERSVELLARETALREHIDDPIALARCAYARGTLRWRRSEHRIALERFGEAIRGLVEVGHRRGLAHSMNMAAACEERLGRPDDAAAYLERSAAIFDALGDRAGLRNCALSMADVMTARGRHTEAIEWARRAVELGEALGNARGLHLALVTLGDVLLAAGKPTEARQTLERALGGEALSESWSTAYARDKLGDVLAALGEHEAAIGQWQAALAIFERIGNTEAAQSTRHKLAR